jgi:sigma-B regulation protein RsbU (phosphoserine phosphatase)
VDSGWWQSRKAFLVDDAGNILASTITDRHGQLSDTNDPLEQATLKALSSKPFGTLHGKGMPPKEVSGFSKLKEAPWSLVMIAPGNVILAPIIRFRMYYFICGTAVIILIVLLIRFVTWRTVTDIKKVSTAADKLARGDYGQPLPVKTKDEVGELTRNFNTMVHQLEERMQMKEAMNLAMEVQQNLLPRAKPLIEGLDIAGKSIYCDETGGDFFDFLKGYGRRADHISIAVGDVSGHGISAALLMATVRASLRSRIAQSGNISEIITDVNRSVAEDTQETGDFMTLFFVDIDPNEKTLRWVRAGHDPAFLYDPASDDITELQGKGIALGIDSDFVYQDKELAGLSKDQILLIGTDGLWEATNEAGEMFGKERLKELISKYSDSSADEILDFIIESLGQYTGESKQEDDVTLVVVKVAA